jgi:hypothetical protein
MRRGYRRVCDTRRRVYDIYRASFTRSALNSAEPSSHGGPRRRKVDLPVHVHVQPPRHARLVRKTLGKVEADSHPRADDLD